MKKYPQSSMENNSKKLLGEALEILESLGLPRGQRNDRSALCLLALLNLAPGKSWADASDSPIGITPIMDWIRIRFRKNYAPNTRETVRRQTMHQFVAAGLVVLNADLPTRPPNSPKTTYRIHPLGLKLIRGYGSRKWKKNLAIYLESQETLASKYAMERDQNRVPVSFGRGKKISLSPGAHSELIRNIIENFAPRFAPGSRLIYAGDTGKKWGYFDEAQLNTLGVKVDAHGKMPDVVLHFAGKNWLLLVESVTSHGPVDAKRHEELRKLFSGSTAGIVYVTAFPNRTTLGRYLAAISWETEVWVADSPSHLIHFNGERFLGPYSGT